MHKFLQSRLPKFAHFFPHLVPIELNISFWISNIRLAQINLSWSKIEFDLAYVNYRNWTGPKYPQSLIKQQGLIDK